jgi:hypothetical protein
MQVLFEGCFSVLPDENMAEAIENYQNETVELGE